MYRSLTDDMENAVNSANVRKESVAQALALGSATDQTGDIFRTQLSRKRLDAHEQISAPMTVR